MIHDACLLPRLLLRLLAPIMFSLRFISINLPEYFASSSFESSFAPRSSASSVDLGGRFVHAMFLPSGMCTPSFIQKTADQLAFKTTANRQPGLLSTQVLLRIFDVFGSPA